MKSLCKYIPKRKNKKGIKYDIIGIHQVFKYLKEMFFNLIFAFSFCKIGYNGLNMVRAAVQSYPLSVYYQCLLML